MIPEVEKTQSITVEFNGEMIKLFRDEILNDPTLKDTFIMYENIRQELVDIEFERGKLIHAQSSMKHALQTLAFKHVEAKGKVMLPPDTEKGENDES